MSRPSRTASISRSARFWFGTVTVTWRNRLVTRVTLGARPHANDPLLFRDLERVLRGGRIPKRLQVDVNGLSDFGRRVLGACAGIRPGRVLTYGELARRAGRPAAARAVGQVLARNPFPILIPCHRVVGSGARLGGYAGGSKWKEALLAAEGWAFEGRGRSRRLRMP